MNGQDQPNSLAPPPSAMPSPLGHIQADLDFAKARFKKLSELKSRVDNVRSELAELTKLGDTVDQDDVVKAAGRLVSGGAAPVALAGLLADMPTNGGGTALAGWIAQHAAQSAAKDQAITQQLAVARHEMGVSALRMLAAHHLGLDPSSQEPTGASAMAPSPSPSPSPSGGNPLAATAGAGNA